MKVQSYEKEHLETLRKILPECTLFLKRNGDFPLKETGKIALYGSGVRNTIKGGTGSGEVNSRFSVNVEQGLEYAGFEIVTKPWLDAYDEIRKEAKKQFGKDLKAKAKEMHTNVMTLALGAIAPEPEYDLDLEGDCDTAVYVLSRISGEGNDRTYDKGDFTLTDTEIRDINACAEKYGKFMLVINAGGPVDLSPLTGVENILVLSQLGVDTGHILADILSGKAYPSGKLTTTWAKPEDYPEIGEFGEHDDTRYREGIYVGYRYFATVGKKAAYPFGYGLGYTDFEIRTEDVYLEGEKVFVKVLVKNTGDFCGKEVVQVYVKKPSLKLDQPAKVLAAFKKTRELKPSEEQTLTLSFDFSELASYDTENASYILELGNYVLCVGRDSENTKMEAAVLLPKTVTVRQVRNIGGTPDFTDYRPEEKVWEPVPDDIRKLNLDPDCIPCTTVEYDHTPEIEGLVEDLSDEELAYLNVGAFDEKLGALSIIGNASSKVAGAAGESTSKLTGKGVEALVMSDGPAGLRLSRDYYIDDNGNAKAIGETLPASLLDYMPKAMTLLMGLLTKKPKAGTVIKHQYATAIPIGTAIAQTFDPEVAELCGDIVGEEMERFNVDLWLAPALNIHRDVRCGRNYEYFSEDPLVSGIFAAAITKGVQKHPGKGTTIKHFCVNNQETNRYCNNSIVSERALREIYLRGFGICIKESRPLALMTSYNLLNGTHTSERRDIITDYLKAECGYEGIIMTDWIVSIELLAKGSVHEPSQASKTAAAGEHLYMPGSKGDYENILKALQEGTLSREQLKANASELIRVIRKIQQAKEA